MLSRELAALAARNGHSMSPKDGIAAAIEFWAGIQAGNILVRGEQCITSADSLQFMAPAPGGSGRVFYFDQLGGTDSVNKSFSPAKELPLRWTKELITLFDRLPDYLLDLGYDSSGYRFKKRVNIGLDPVSGTIYVETAMDHVTISRKGSSPLSIPGSLSYRFKLTPEDALLSDVGLQFDSREIQVSTDLLKDLYFTHKAPWRDSGEMRLRIEDARALESRRSMAAEASRAKPKR